MTREQASQIMALALHYGDMSSRYGQAANAGEGYVEASQRRSDAYTQLWQYVEECRGE